MVESIYDSCLLYRLRAEKNESFEVVGMQIDDTLILANETFAKHEEEAIIVADIKSKSRDQLATGHPIKFNDTIIELDDHGNINLRQEVRKTKEISLVTNKNGTSTSIRGIIRPHLSPKEQYVAQRARGAYIASICQSEAAFDLSHAAQSTKFTTDDITSLNKRLQ